ncbi:MAG: hypothetical protein ACLR1U_03655 [Clostridia bacterium]|jgi:hypothetical protein
MNKIEKNNRKFFNKIYKKIKKHNFNAVYKIIVKESNKNRIKKLKKHKFRTFIRKILTKKYKDGKHAKIIIFDEIHNYKEDNSLLENLYTTNWLDTRKEIFKNNLVNIYQANYMQNPFKILTEENLNRLEEHCKKAIRYERGELKKEHEVTLELLYEYQKQEEEIVKQNKIINLMSEKIFEEGIVWDNKEEVIDYFRKKVEAKENE